MADRKTRKKAPAGASAEALSHVRAPEIDDAERSLGRAVALGLPLVTVVAAITTPEKALPKVTSFGPAGKRRSTLAIVVLSVVTLGIYSLVWYHRVNREVGNFDTRMHVVPGRSTVAVAIPWAIGWLVSIAGAIRIVLAVANVALPFDPHFTVLQAYGLLGGGLFLGSRLMGQRLGGFFRA